AGVRDRDRGRRAVRAVAAPLDVLARRREPGRAEAYDRGRGEYAVALLADGEQLRLHVQLGVGLAPRDRLLHVRLAPAPSGRARSAPADARNRSLRMARLP